MSSAAEATRTIARPTSRTRRLQTGRFGRMLVRTPFYLVIAVIAVYKIGRASCRERV